MKLWDSFRRNPFFILQSSSTNTRTELIEKQEEMALFGDGDQADRALSKLLNPQTRIEAEIEWFPHMSAQETLEMIRCFERQSGETMWPKQHFFSVLALFNVLRMALSRLEVSTAEQCLALFRSLAAAADTLIPGQVLEELNEDRKTAGFPLIGSKSDAEVQIRNLLRETAIAYAEKAAGTVKGEEIKKLSERLKKQYKNAASPYHNSYFLELAADLLGGIAEEDARIASSGKQKTN